VRWVTGDYVRPTSGEYVGQLGPWATLLQRVGIDPMATGVKLAFVSLGAAWLAGAIGYALGCRWAHGVLLAAGGLSIWYLPFGTDRVGRDRALVLRPLPLSAA